MTLTENSIIFSFITLLNVILSGDQENERLMCKRVKQNIQYVTNSSGLDNAVHLKQLFLYQD